MHITKIVGSYDDYKIELSWSELKAIQKALEANHHGVVADETHARLQYYIGNLPGPGEEKEKGDDKTVEQTKADASVKDAAGLTNGTDINPDDVPFPDVNAQPGDQPGVSRFKPLFKK